MSQGDAVPGAALDRAVQGVNLRPGSLRDQIGREPTLLVFLRHFGCAFCRETMADLRDAADKDPGFPAVLFFFQGSPLEGKAFLRRYWPEARAVADPELRFYEDFGVGQGGWMQMLGPRVWSAGRRAQAKGHTNGARVGDVWRMPGLFLVAEDRLLWSHRFRHAGDHPEFAEIPRLAALAGAPTPPT